jgi:hypothetical protein
MGLIFCVISGFELLAEDLNIVPAEGPRRGQGIASPMGTST